MPDVTLETTGGALAGVIATILVLVSGGFGAFLIFTRRRTKKPSAVDPMTTVVETLRSEEQEEIERIEKAVEAAAAELKLEASLPIDEQSRKNADWLNRR